MKYYIKYVMFSFEISKFAIANELGYGIYISDVFIRNRKRNIQKTYPNIWTSMHKDVAIIK